MTKTIHTKTYIDKQINLIVNKIVEQNKMINLLADKVLDLQDQIMHIQMKILSEDYKSQGHFIDRHGKRITYDNGKQIKE